MDSVRTDTTIHYYEHPNSSARRITSTAIACARLAIGFAIFLAIGKIVRNWGGWGFWPFVLVDYLASGLLLVGGAWQLKRASPASRAILCGAWGFVCAVFYMSFWRHVQFIDQPDHGPIPHGPLTAIIGVMFVVTVVGFVMSLLVSGSSHAAPTKGRLPPETAPHYSATEEGVRQTA